MSDWQEYLLDDCLETLIDYRGKSPKKSPSGVPVISAKVVKGGRILHPIEQTIEPTYYAEWMRRGYPRAGDVVLTTEGPLGEVAQLDFRTAQYALGQRIVVLRGHRDIIDNTFLKFLLLSPIGQERLSSYATGTTVEGISQKSLRKLRLPVPPIGLQRQIAELLGSLDDRIELNRQVNETLEAMAQAIFRDWFVDFGPTRRIVEGASDPVEIVGGLVTDAERAQQLADLFPTRFGDNGLPQGWASGAATDLIEFNPKERLRKGTVAPYTDMSSLPTAGLIAEEPVQREFGSGMRFHNGDALLARITPCLENGKAAFVDFLPAGQVGWGSTEFFVLRAKGEVPPPFSYLLVRLPEFRAVAIASMTGTSGRQRAQIDRLEAFPMARPDKSVFMAFGSFVEPIFQKISGNGEENRTLAAARDLLLPKLMSGEIRLQEADEIWEAAQ
ncbi:restriction endonuclease subunit S [Ensifer adhaerens]|uniref:restriction endonuclease subunit S n=1 Tax=Ensifer canadensis TaxID=555315 RepID=UPI001490692F|nr:restriction endonuclease subunit S [Ensifer canadensis]NOV21233.1 restriction endonuclease subunit S [Ensifer canadensis]